MMKSLIPIGRDSSLARTEANPLAMLQQEMDRLFDGFVSIRQHQSICIGESVTRQERGPMIKYS